MVKYNKAVDCNQFKKDIHPLIKTWLNQPARKERRRRNRHKKIAAYGISPINSLRPFVNCCGKRYNDKLRAGRGFTLEELKGANLTVATARSLAISVDPRRVNANKESLDKNINRLKEYLSKLIIVPKNKESKQINGIGEECKIVGKTIVNRINNKPCNKHSVLVN